MYLLRRSFTRSKLKRGGEVNKDMPCKKTKKKAEPQTYFQAKNKRWYKKIVVDGKTRCRFVSTAEATGQIKPKQPKAPKASQAKPTGTSSPSPPTSQPKAPASRRPRRKRNEEPKDAPSANDE